MQYPENIIPENIITDIRSGLVFLKNSTDGEIYITLNSVIAFVKTEQNTVEVYSIIKQLRKPILKEYNGMRLLNLAQVYKVLLRFNRKFTFKFFQAGMTAFYEFMESNQINE